MKMYYQVFNNWNADDVAALKSSGLSVELGFQTIKISDKNLFDELESLFKQSGAMVTMGTEFSERDNADAHYLSILPTWQTLYPQPERDFAFRKETYDLADYCSSCGVGAVQKAPFRISKAVDWKQKKAFFLHWTFDAIFVRADVYEKIFAPAGVDFFPVLLHKTGEEIEDIRQLKIGDAASTLTLDNRSSEECRVCRRKKYSPNIDGYFPSFADDSAPQALVMSREYCGSGTSASKWIIASQTLRKALLAEKVNCTFWPSGRMNE